jgi:hypothetical protein
MLRDFRISYEGNPGMTKHILTVQERAKIIKSGIKCNKLHRKKVM